MLNELTVMIIGIGGPTTFFLYCLYLVSRSDKKRYTVGNQAFKPLEKDRSVFS